MHVRHNQSTELKTVLKINNNKINNKIAEPFSKGRTPAERITPPQMKYDWKGQDVLRTGFSIVGFTVTEMH